FFFEQKHSGIVCGVDEAGRGPWAGPVVAGAAILDRTQLPEDLLQGLDDSKKLKAAKREILLARLMECDAVQLGLGIASVEEVDHVNILQATFLAMKRAVENLALVPDFALIDGNKIPPHLPCPAEAVIKGDGLSLSIAAASIQAKVARDHMMVELDLLHPGYGWANNAGYGTKQHQEGLKRLGITPHHRKSFAPIRKILSLGDS
ncbi:MAG: ribonuclease HII, partial [Magnetovibrio sp.]|nr:ribonuclease HII [Magnetovibrio sp.]